MSLKSFINLIFILITLTLAYAQESNENKETQLRYIKILKVNDGKSLEAGKTASMEFKFLEQTKDKSFNFILRDEGKKIFEKVGTISDETYQFKKDNTYDTTIQIPANIPSGDYLIYGYLDQENKVSDSFSVKVKGNSEVQENKATNNQNLPTNSTTPITTTTSNLTTTSGASISTTKPNVSTAGNAVNNNENNPLNWRNIIIIGSIVGVILIIFALLFYCCIKDGRKSRKGNEWDLPRAVSEPHLVSSSSPINAIPLYNQNNVNPMSPMSPMSPINKNAQQFSSPAMSPLIHSNSNYSDVYQNQETQGLTASTRMRQENDSQSPYNRNTIYSSESVNSPQDDEMSSPSPSYYFQAFKPHQVYRVLYDFQPSLPDEMELQPGDIIRTEETFEDGWAFGINMSTGKQGTFPMNCLEDDNASEGDTKSVISERSHSRRTSSLNPQNAQIIQMMLKNGNQSQSFQKSYYMSQINNMKV